MNPQEGQLHFLPPPPLLHHSTVYAYNTTIKYVVYLLIVIERLHHFIFIVVYYIFIDRKFHLYRTPKQPEPPVQSVPTVVTLENGSPQNNIKQYPGVSILKPLVGVDPNLFVNLSSYFEMEYPMVMYQFTFFKYLS